MKHKTQDWILCMLDGIIATIGQAVVLDKLTAKEKQARELLKDARLLIVEEMEERDSQKAKEDSVLPRLQARFPGHRFTFVDGKFMMIVDPKTDIDEISRLSDQFRDFYKTLESSAREDAVESSDEELLVGQPEEERMYSKQEIIAVLENLKEHYTERAKVNVAAACLVIGSGSDVDYAGLSESCIRAARWEAKRDTVLSIAERLSLELGQAELGQEGE